EWRRGLVSTLGRGGNEAARVHRATQWRGGGMAVLDGATDRSVFVERPMSPQRRGSRDLERGRRGHRAAALHLCPGRPGRRRERIAGREHCRAPPATLIHHKTNVSYQGPKLWSEGGDDLVTHNQRSLPLEKSYAGFLPRRFSGGVPMAGFLGRSFRQFFRERRHYAPLCPCPHAV